MASSPHSAAVTWALDPGARQPQGPDNFNRVGAAQWSASEGVIQASRGGKDAGFLVTKRAYKDVMIRAEFWSSDDAKLASGAIALFAL